VQRLVSLAACILIAGLAAAAAGWLAFPESGLRGSYYTNLTRTGPPMTVTIDRTLSTDTLDNGAAGVWPAFSAEWSGFLVITRAGRYEFAVTSDDGSELAIDDRDVVRNGGLHGPQEARGAIDLAAGIHPIRLRYEQAGGGFVLDVRFGRSGETLAEIPAARLLPDRMSFVEYRLRRAVPWAAAGIAVVLWLVVASKGRLERRAGHEGPIAKHAIAAIVLVGVAVRIVMMLGSNPILWGDSDVFLDTADAIRAGRYLQHDPFRTLLYPYFLAPFLGVSTEPPMDQVIVGAQHLLGVAAAVCFYLAGRVALGSRAALAGALLFAVHTTALFYENSILSETLFVFVLAAGLLAIGWFADAPSAGRAIAAGAACAALTYTRPVAQWFFLVPVALVIAGGWSLPQRPASARWRPRPWRQRLALAAIITISFAALMLPWALVNQQQYGFFGIAIGRGFGLYIRVFEIDRFDPPADTGYPEARDLLMRARTMHQESPASQVLNWLGDRRRYSFVQKDAIMAQAAAEAVRQHPVRFAVNSIKQWSHQLSGPLGDEAICTSAEVGSYVCSSRTVGYAREPFLNRPRRADQPLRPWVVSYFRHARIPFTLVSALALFGVVAALARPAPAAAHAVLLALTIAYFTFLPALAQSPQDRYRLPVDALLLMFAAFGVMRLIQEVRRPLR
jgi:hypothetical protein